MNTPSSAAAWLPTAPTEAGERLPLRDEAYAAIKQRIITCEFKPGGYLNEAKISLALGIGRTPVHQAIERLEQDGLVEIMPRKGIIVTALSVDTVAQIIDVRLINEPYCAMLAAERIDANELAALHNILERTDAATSAHDTNQMMLLDREFHMAIASAARNPILASILQNLHERSLRFWFLSLTAQEQQRSVQDEHLAIADALQRRDRDGATQAMRAHIESFRKNIIHRV